MLHRAAAQRGGDWPDQPDIQPRSLRTDRAVEVAATEDRLKAKTKTRNDPKPINCEQLIVQETPTKTVTMKTPTPKTEVSPLTQPRKVVFGGSHLLMLFLPERINLIILDSSQ